MGSTSSRTEQSRNCFMRDLVHKRFSHYCLIRDQFLLPEGRHECGGPRFTTSRPGSKLQADVTEIVADATARVSVQASVRPVRSASRKFTIQHGPAALNST